MPLMEQDVFEAQELLDETIEQVSFELARKNEPDLPKTFSVGWEELEPETGKGLWYIEGDLYCGKSYNTGHFYAESQAKGYEAARALLLRKYGKLIKHHDKYKDWWLE